MKKMGLKNFHIDTCKHLILNNGRVFNKHFHNNRVGTADHYSCINIRRKANETS